MQDNFICRADPSTRDLARTVRDAIGKDGGVVPGSMEHGCMECTHRKRYRSDLEREGATIGDTDLENVVAGDDLNDDNTVSILFNTPQEKNLFNRNRTSLRLGKMHLLQKSTCLSSPRNKLLHLLVRNEDMLDLLGWMVRLLCIRYVNLWCFVPIFVAVFDNLTEMYTG